MIIRPRGKELISPGPEYGVDDVAYSIDYALVEFNRLGREFYERSVQVLKDPSYFSSLHYFHIREFLPETVNDNQDILKKAVLMQFSEGYDVSTNRRRNVSVNRFSSNFQESLRDYFNLVRISEPDVPMRLFGFIKTFRDSAPLSERFL